MTSRRETKFLCGTASQILIQAITSLGGHARRVELRFTPANAHAVVEAWSVRYNKWVVLDPDYDIYYTVEGIPQNAVELHRHWAENRVDKVDVHNRDSAHDIYLKEYKNLDPALIRSIYETGNFTLWDKEIKETNPEYHRHARFSVKLLNYYSHLSYPLRNDWVTRPLKWWHPEGNHVQNSLVIQLETMRRDGDFLLEISSPDLFYQSPL